MGSARKKRRNEKKVLVQKEKREKSRVIKKEKKIQRKRKMIGEGHMEIKASVKHAVEGVKNTENRNATVVYMPKKTYDFAITWLKDGVYKFENEVKPIAWDVDLHMNIIAECDVDIDKDIVAD